MVTIDRLNGLLFSQLTINRAWLQPVRPDLATFRHFGIILIIFVK